MRVVSALMLILGLGAQVFAAHAAPTARARQLAGVPPRSADAINGSEFARRTMGMSGAERQRAAIAQLRQGNIPAVLRDLKPVLVTAPAADGRTHTAEFWVTPDYLAIGSDEDFLRMPLTYPVALTIADLFESVLPTRKMVDAIYAQSTCRLKPEPLPPGRKMRSSEYYLVHRQKIERQRTDECARGQLVAGHKKDVVITNRLRKKRQRIAIYGWHRGIGQPIQPLSTVHGANYADYSHGVRLVARDVWIDGERRSVFEVLEDPELAALLTDEGEIIKPRVLMRVSGR